MKTRTNNTVLTVVMVLGLLGICGGTALAGDCPEKIRILAESPVDRIEIGDLYAAGKKLVGLAIMTLDDGSEVSLVVKLKEKSKGGARSWRMSLKSIRGVLPKVKVKLLVLDGNPQQLMKGKLILKQPGMPAHKLILTPSAVELSSEDPINPGNEPPVAKITLSADSGTAPLSVTMDASESHDPDGSVESAHWSMGDGAQADGMSVQHTFSNPGSFTVRLSVTDDKGKTGEATATVTVDPPATQDRPEWTFMVYLGADNSLSTFGHGDIDEMEKIGSTSSVNVVVQAEFSRNPEHQDPDPSYHGETLRFRVEKNGDSLKDATSIGNVDMGAPETLRDFISWAADTYPAERYALVIWDHGAGWRLAELDRGAVEDETSGSFMSLPDLARAVRDSGVQIDLIDFDACVMAMYEVAVEFEGLCDFLVASETNEPGAGNPYDTILGDLTARPEMSARELSIKIADRFYEFYLPYEGEKDMTVTKSVVDMTAVPALESAVEHLGNSITAEFDAVADTVLAAQIESSDADSCHIGMPGNVDLIGFCASLAQQAGGQTGSAAQQAKAAAETAIIHSRTLCAKAADATGLAIFAPQKGQVAGTGGTLAEYADLASSQAGGWLSAVEKMESYEGGGGGGVVFTFAIVWATDANIDLGMVEPGGHVSYGWHEHPDSPVAPSQNGDYEWDLPGELYEGKMVYHETFTVYENAASGKYAPVINCYQLGSQAYTDVTLVYKIHGEMDGYEAIDTFRFTEENQTLSAGVSINRLAHILGSRPATDENQKLKFLPGERLVADQR